MNKKLKLLQRPRVLKTLEVEKVKHDLSKIENSTIVMVAYDDATDKFLIGDNSGDLYVATSEYLNSLDIKNLNINSFINKLTKSSISEHFNKITLQEAKKMFSDRYVYYWSANNKIYGVKKGIIEQLDNGPDNTKVVELWDRTENVLSNDRGVTGLKEVHFSAELRPAFLTFSEAALPAYERDNNLIIRDPVKIADILNTDLQNHDYVPDNDKYGYDMKDSNAVMKAYLGTDDLIVLSNIDKREVIDINPPTVDPDDADVEYNNNTPFNHNYNMIWSTIRSARLFEAFNDEKEDANPNFVNMTRHEQNELIIPVSAVTAGTIATRHVNLIGLYASVPNLAEAYTMYIEGDRIGKKQIYNNGTIGESVRNQIRWSLDSVNGTNCVVTKRVYNPITGEIENAKATYNAVMDYTIDQIKDNTCRIKKVIRIPVLNDAICNIKKFEQIFDSSGAPISLPVPNEYDDGIVEYSLDTSNYSQGTNGTVSYGLRKVFIQSGATKVLLGTTSITGIADFSVYTLGSNAVTANIKRNTEVIFKNTDGTNYIFKTSNNSIGTGTVSYSVASTPTSVYGSDHRSKHTRTITYLSGSTNVIIKTDDYESPVSYRIYTLNAGSNTATLKGSSTGAFKTIVNGSETNTIYNIAQNDHITVTSNTITYSLNNEVYEHSGVTCSQNMNISYTYGGVTIKKVITKSAKIIHSVYTLEANASTATIKRVFTPVFYTISAGVESTANIFKNNTITIDTNKTAAVSYTASNSVTSASGSNHYATHTRLVTYTQNSVYVAVNTTNVNAAISYRIYTLSAGSNTATLKGSSTGEFKTIVNGSETSTTYNVPQNDHMAVTSANGVYSNSGVTYTSTSATCTRTLSFNYTYGGVTISKTISKSAAVNHSIYTINSSSATVKRVFTPVFKTIVNGSETTSNYKTDQVTIDTNQSATVSYTVSNSVTSASGSNHYATHTRTITYKPTSISQTYTIFTDSVSAPVSYRIYTLSAGSTTATLKGSSTGAFKTIVNGSETSTTYNIAQNDHITVNGNVSYTVSNSVTSASGSNHYATHTRTVTYTQNSVSVGVNTTNNAAISYRIYTLSAGSNTATLKGSSTGVFKTIVNGSETSTTYNVPRNDHITVNGTVTSFLDIISSYTASLKEAYLQLIVNYTFNNVTIQLIKNSDNYNITVTLYGINEHDNIVTFTRSYSPTIKCISDGVETNTNYFSGSRSLPNVHGTITQTLTIANHANDYNFNIIIKDSLDVTVVNTNSMNVIDRLGGVSLKEAASMLLNNTDNAKNKVYIGDYFELGGYEWYSRDDVGGGKTFTAGTAKYTLVERTSSGNLIFMSSERHKLTTQSYGAIGWVDLISFKYFEKSFLPQLESILGVTPVSYTRKSNIQHLKNQHVFLPTEYEIFGEYTYQDEDDKYDGERQWEIFNFNKEENRKIFRRDVNTGDINNYASSDSYNGEGYWLANQTRIINSTGGVGYVDYPDRSDFGFPFHGYNNLKRYGVRPCFML